MMLDNPFKGFGGKWQFIGPDWAILDRKVWIKQMIEKRASLRGIQYKRMRRKLSLQIVAARVELMELTLQRD